MSDSKRGVRKSIQYPEELFTEKRRAQLYYLTTELLPPPRLDGYDEVGGAELRQLDRLLRMKLGLLSLGSGRLPESLQNFIVTRASHDELYAILELIPAAIAAAAQEEARQIPFYQSSRNMEKEIEAAIGEIDRFLEGIGSSARFGQDRRLHFEDVLVQDVPRALSELPTKQNLINDIQTALSKDTPAAVIFVDPRQF